MEGSVDGLRFEKEAGPSELSRARKDCSDFRALSVAETECPASSELSTSDRDRTAFPESLATTTADLPGPPVADRNSLSSKRPSVDADHEGSPDSSPPAGPNYLDCPDMSAAGNHHTDSPTIRAVETDSRKPGAAERDRSRSPQPSVTAMDHRHFSKPSPIEPDCLLSYNPSSAEMDCPVCFSRYDIHRTPKLLACKHTFCAVCLKLLLRNEDGAWLITCPLCRTSTVVFGGLICSLPTREDLMGNASPNAEIHHSTQRGACPDESTVGRRPHLDDDEGNVSVTARRLVMLLLILVILVIIVLQFMYSGLMKWILCFTATVLIIMSVILCSRISFQRALHSTDLQKDNQIVSAS
ncbi:E3 ubiquitin-protein ligase RNF186 [Rhinatrema bivittatum]|uniref:E3 ubiquitin-protein ligase RNF186 n=1 Tax=Rhinatrema bivittatum TaxID=194408 RepID=UPI00112E064F|nr:E3 ubiquitin-protein ligase RNF186 [Rhinatrema bivittatum]